MSFTTPRWAQFGLCIVEGADYEAAYKAHELVADYLLAHPDVRERYRADQRGEVKYYDVLRLAEQKNAPA